MSMRLQEIHPSLVHFPIALLPVSLAADALGRLTGSKSLMDMGRRTMPVAAASGLLAGAFGFIAQQTVEINDHTQKMLVTHRNLNVAAVGASMLLAWKRSRSDKPTLGYLAAGLATVGAVTYSAYLGGHMVYEHGVGVKTAGGLRESAAPPITRDNAREVAQLAGKHLTEGLQMAASETAEGQLVPWLTAGAEPRSSQESRAASSDRSQSQPA